MKKEFQGLEESSEVDIHLKLLRAAPTKIPKWKTPGHDGIQGFLFEKNEFAPIHDRLAQQMIKFLEETRIPKWTKKGKTTQMDGQKLPQQL